MNTIFKILLTAISAYGLTYVLSGVQVNDLQSALIFAVVFGLINLIVKPIVKLFSLPITIITLGLFSLVINALMVLLADHFVDGINVDGFWWALIFSLALSLISSIFGGIFEKKDK